MISYLIRNSAMLARNLGLIALAAALAVGLAGGRGRRTGLNGR
jgi:hypothetical protein